jgi:hypothetical protein
MSFEQLQVPRRTLAWKKPLFPFEVDEELHVQPTKRKPLLQQRGESRQ